MTEEIKEIKIFNNTYEAAKFYWERGLAVIPLRPGEKAPFFENWTKLPFPTAGDLKEWNRKYWKRGYNIGVRCGEISGGLVNLDFDEFEGFKWFIKEVLPKLPDTIKYAINNTWIVRTGARCPKCNVKLVGLKCPKCNSEYKLEDLKPENYGYRILLRVNGHVETEKITNAIEIRAEGTQVVMPPSIHPSGVEYVFVLNDPREYELQTLTEEEWKELRRLLAVREEKPRERPVRVKRELSEGQISEIVDTLKPYYIKGWRDYIVHYLLGALVKNGVSYESSYKLIETLCDIMRDEEKDQRLYLVEYHYGKRAADIGIERLKGFTGLREVIAKQLIEKGTDPEEARDQALEVVNKLNEILGVPIERRIILVPIKTGSRFQAYCNDPDRGILILLRRNSEINREYILGYYVEKVTVLVNPSDPNDRSYTIILKHPKTDDTLVYHESTISSIVADLENTKHGVRNPSKLKGAISSIIEAFVIRGLAEIKSKIPATGFFEIDGQLVWFDSPRFKVNLKEDDREKTIEALNALNELLGFYRYSHKALASLYYGIQAPLGFIRKVHGRENKILFNYGEPHTGKTLLMKIIGYMWGMREDQSIIGAAKITGPQLAERMNYTTLPITLDEVRTILTQADIIDMIKASTTNIHIKSRILPQLGYKMIEFYAYASISMTTNYVPQLLPGFEERLIPLEWTVEDKREEKEVEEFLQKLAEYKDLLAYIGSYLRGMYIRRWKEVKEIIMDIDQVDIGRKLLELLYEDLGIPKPEWLKKIEVKYEIETPTPEEIFFDTIREDLIEAVKKAGIVLEVKDSYGIEAKIDLTKMDWKERILTLAQLGFLPSYMVLGKKNIYIKTSIIEHIRKKKGYEIPGGLKNLALKLNYKYGPKPKVGKSMWIPLEDLVEKLVQEVEEEEG